MSVNAEPVEEESLNSERLEKILAQLQLLTAMFAEVHDLEMTTEDTEDGDD